MASIRPEDNFSSVDLLCPPSIASTRVFDVPIVLACEHTLVHTGIARLEGSFASCACDITPWPLAGWRKLQAGTGSHESLAPSIRAGKLTNVPSLHAGIEGGIVEDLFTMDRRGCVQYATNAAVGRTYVTGWYSDPAR